MNKIKSKIFLAVSVLFFMSTSCSDFLTLEPENSLVQEEFWQNEGHVESAVAACYASMNQSNYISRVIQWGELRAEMVYPRSVSTNQSNMYKGYMLSSNNITSWANFYTTINLCNTVLHFSDQAKANDPTFTEDALNIYKAEAKSIRALTYLILVKNFRDVPLVTTATLSDQEDFYIAKSSESEVLAQIIGDLNESLAYLPEGYAESIYYDKGVITKGGALAILADAYLWAGQYNNCLDACQAITDLGKYSLVDGNDWFNDIFFEGNSSEGIFELQFSDVFTTIRSYYAAAVAPSFLAYPSIADLYAGNPNDKRAANSTYENGTNYVFKYSGLDPVTGEHRESDQFYNNWIFYRYADILLMQAEAYIFSEDRQNLNEAYALINQIYERATATPLDLSVEKGTLVEALLLERQRELAYEGKRWHDLLRFARRNNFENQQLILDMAESKTTVDNYEEVMSYYSDTASYFLPIYQNEINLNDNLVQNPYYDEN